MEGHSKQNEKHKKGHIGEHKGIRGMDLNEDWGTKKGNIRS